MDIIAWEFLIPLVAVGGGITYAILASFWKAKSRSADANGHEELRRALDSNTAANLGVVAKLNGLDERLSSVEKTLTDIP